MQKEKYAYFNNDYRTQLNAATVIKYSGVHYDINFLSGALTFWNAFYLKPALNKKGTKTPSLKKKLGLLGPNKN